MNKLIRILFPAMLLLVACHSSLFAQIHADLAPYHARFIAEAKARGIATMPVVAPATMQFFKNGKKDIRGGCFFQDKAVYINRLYWDDAGESQREIIVFHELAHWYLKAGYTRHITDDIMNPNAVFPDYAGHRSKYLDILFQRIYETPVDRHALTLKAGDIIITSDDAESETFRVFTIKDGTEAEKTRSLAVIDSVIKTHVQYDYINAKGWRFKPYEYTGISPVVQYDARISEVWGEMNRMYMFAAHAGKAPKLGANNRIRWNEDVEMTLVVDYKTTTIAITRNATVMYYVKQLPSVAKVRKEINLP